MADTPPVMDRKVSLLGQRAKRQLKYDAFKFFWTFNEEIKRRFKRSYFKALPQDDQYRLLTLRTWSIKYKVPVSFVIQTVVEYWMRKLPPRKKTGIGISVSTLTGPTSEKILTAEIERLYPDQEHLRAWKSEAQMKLTSRGVKDIRTSDAFDFVSRYVKVMERRQQRVVKSIASGQHVKHRYRDNPFV